MLPTTIYTYKPRHWSPESEPFTGVDSLLGALLTGWTIDNRIHRQEFWRGGSRPVTVFYCDLSRDGVSVTMPVISNPYMKYIVEFYELHVVQYATEDPITEF